MKNKRFRNLIYQASLRQPFSVLIATQVLADAKLQEILVSLGTGKLIILLCGEPGAGKTSTVRVVARNYREIKFAEGLKEIKHVVQEMCSDMEKEGMPLEILFLDNFPNSLSLYKLETSRRILDYVVDILSEDEKSPLVIITGEPQALEEFEKKEYLIGRTVPVWMPNLDKDIKMYNIRKEFVEYEQEFDALWKAYADWAEEHPVDKKTIAKDLEGYRKRYFGQYDSRRVGLVFCYHYALYRFSDFLESYFGEKLDATAIEDNANDMLQYEETIRRLSRDASVSYEVSVWNEFINREGTLKTYIPGKAPCELICRSECYNDEDESFRCHKCGGVGYGLYNPMDLRMPKNPACGILIEDVRLIPKFPKHIVCNTPILMIQAKALQIMMNTFLESYSREKGVNMLSISPKRLTRQLFLHNLCLFEYVGNMHNAYTFRMRDTNNEDRRVLFIKLTDMQYQKLKREAEPVERRWGYSYSYRDVKGMNDCLKYFCDNVRSLIGEPGAPSMMLDAIE